MATDILRRPQTKVAGNVGAALLAILCVIYMTSLDPRPQTILTEALLLGSLAVSFQLVYGVLGELSLGISGFFGAGAYTYAVLGIHGAPMALAITGAAACGLAVGAFVATVTARLGGVYFSVATFALAGIGKAIASGTKSLGKTEGLIGIPGFAEIGGLTRIQSQLVYAAVTFALFILVIAVLRRSLLGFALATVRADPGLARSVGLNIAVLRVIVTGLSGLLAGLSGVVFAQGARYVGPDVFSILYVVAPLSIVVIGGLHYSAAAIPGAMLVIAIPELLDLSGTAQQILSASVLLVVILVQPDGILGGFAAASRRLSGRRVARTSGSGHAGVAVSATPLADLGRGRASGDRPALVVEGVTVTFGKFVAVDDVTLAIGTGEIVGLIGANGAGKSTLVNAISGLVETGSGVVRVAGADITRLPAHRRARRGISRTFQQSLVADSLTVRQNLRVAQATGRFVRGAPSDDAEITAAACGLGSQLDRDADSLSFMNRRLLSIAMALVSSPSVIMLDEATAGLSDAERQSVAILVRTLATDRRTAFLVIEHDVQWVAGLADRIAVLDQGRLLTVGSPAEVLAHAGVISSYLGEAHEPAYL